MSSLALAAHTAHTAAPAFNGLFYATAATVIPVLFLAIAVQGHALQDIVKSYTAALRRVSQGGSWSRILPAVVIFISWPFIFSFTFLYAVSGEILAMIALSQQRAVGLDAQVAVQIAVILLVVVAAGGPFAAVLRATFLAGASSAEEQQPAGAQKADVPASQEPGASPANLPPPETGKTGPA